jgi:NADPH:quinone reductase-like Zn-dependent oxidoreductase
VVLNLVVPGDRLAGTARAVRPGGRLVTITFPVPQPEWLGRDDVDLRFVLDMDGVHGGMREVALDGLTTTIGGRYSLDDGVRAIVDFVGRHTTGKLVVTM